jgi:hypothetical protein
VEGEAIPYSYQLRYDTALDTNQEFFAAGSQLGAYITTHEWHGYSASGLLSVTPLSFGTKTWSLGDLSERPPAIGVTADLWFDTDIGHSTPTRSWITFIGGDFEDYGILELGGGITDGVSVYLESDASIDTFPGGAFSDHATITSVPEPKPVLFMVAGLGILLLSTRRQRTGRLKPEARSKNSAAHSTNACTLVERCRLEAYTT